VHDPLDPEYSILKGRLETYISKRGVEPKTLDLVTLTKLAEEAITSVSCQAPMEQHLVSRCLNPKPKP